MAFEHYVSCGTKRLRCGYTTGVCAALATRAAFIGLCTGNIPPFSALITPAGPRVKAKVQEPLIAKIDGQLRARCGIIKDAGDESDITDGLVIFAEVQRMSLLPKGQALISIDGGEGVGRITKAGLDQDIGEAAINSVPRRMIQTELKKLCRKYEYWGSFLVRISVPGGAERSAHTFNGRLGIAGGISILGTDGIVRPRSEKALIDSIETEIKMYAVQGKINGDKTDTGFRPLLLTPGNYGKDFLEQDLYALYPQLKTMPALVCSNFIGDALDLAGLYEFTHLCLIGHIGKMVKLAGGIMNTHSKYADCRKEIFAAHTALYASQIHVSSPNDVLLILNSINEIFNSVSSDACIEILDTLKIRQPVIKSIMQAIGAALEQRSNNAYKISYVVFSKKYGLLGAALESLWEALV